MFSWEPWTCSIHGPVLAPQYGEWKYGEGGWAGGLVFRVGFGLVACLSVGVWAGGLSLGWGLGWQPGPQWGLGWQPGLQWGLGWWLMVYLIILTY